jgi:hypothetical protein
VRAGLTGWDAEAPFWRRQYRAIIDKINRATDREIDEALRQRLSRRALAEKDQQP